MLRRAALSFHPIRGFYVDLPTYVMVPASWQPVTPGVMHADGVIPGVLGPAAMMIMPTVQVQLPDDFPGTADPATIIAHIRHKYRGHPHFDTDAWTPPNLT